MKYRHVCHAGNFADVMKHVALIAALMRLAEKKRPLFMLDTHAGRGRYEVAGSAEAARGIGRMLAAGATFPDGPIAHYLEAVRAANVGRNGSVRVYPGSPLLAALLLRSHDRAAFCERVPSEAAALRHEFRGDPRIGVHCRDGFEALGALLPPPEKRGLALIDPPYEEQERDLERVADALAAAAARWPQGVLMAWYPIKQGEIAARLHRRLLDAGVRRLLAAELFVHPDDSRAGLNGSGIVAIRPPWRFDEDLRQALPLIEGVLAERGAPRTRVEVLAGE